LSQELTYERALELLDQKLKALEDGDLSLDEALSAVDEARTYLRVCHDRLEEAKKRIEVRPEARPESMPEPQAGPPQEMGRLL
jgi:exodeoxyribonuclease VII small subunit